MVQLFHMKKSQLRSQGRSPHCHTGLEQAHTDQTQSRAEEKNKTNQKGPTRKRKILKVNPSLREPSAELSKLDRNKEKGNHDVSTERQAG